MQGYLLNCLLTATYSDILDVFKELLAGVPGFSYLSIIGCKDKPGVLRDSYFSPSETLLLINLSLLKAVIILLIVALCSVVGSCSKFLYCSVLFNYLLDTLVESFKSSMTTALSLSEFGMTISPLCFIFVVFWIG